MKGDLIKDNTDLPDFPRPSRLKIEDMIIEDRNIPAPGRVIETVYGGPDGPFSPFLYRLFRHSLLLIEGSSSTRIFLHASIVGFCLPSSI